MKRNSFVYSRPKRLPNASSPFFIGSRQRGKTTLPDHGPMIILPKHQYWTDIPIISLAFKPLLYFVAKKELFKYPLIRNYLSLVGGLPVDRKQSIRTLDSFKTLVSLLRAGREDCHLSGRNLFSKWSGLREKSASSDDFEIPIGTGISHSLYSCRHSIWREVRMEKASGSMYWFPSLCREGVRCHSSDPSCHGRNQSSLSIAPLYLVNCGLQIAEFGIKT